MNVFKLVEDSYDKISKIYHDAQDHAKYNDELEKFSSMLPSNSTVLDVGTGSGIPTVKYLTEKDYKVIGVDVSEKMLDLAKENVPEATFFQKNMLTLDFPDETFNGLICIDTLWHIPRSNHFFIYLNFRRMMKDNGILVINTGLDESEGMSDFFGEPMFWSNNSPEKTLALVKKAGFQIEFEGILEGGSESQYWIFAKKISRR